jgi:hypothetical protein
MLSLEIVLPNSCPKSPWGNSEAFINPETANRQLRKRKPF